MIILDTNVISELMKPAPAPAVVDWAGHQTAAALYTTTITQAEILYGVLLLPKGGRRGAIEAAARVIFTQKFEGRLLSFDPEAAEAFGRIAAARRAAGRPMSAFDAQIAAIAACRGATLATRNVGDFEGCGVRLFDPWRGAA